MKALHRILPLLLLPAVFSACQKEIEPLTETALPVNPPPVTPPPGSGTGFIEYLIKKGEQFSDQNTFVVLNTSGIRFTVVFDSSAIYKTIDPANQADINKLYGFSDNASHHHSFSARFGWRWYNNALNLQAYYYNDSVRAHKDLGNVELNKEHQCAILVKGNQYEFILNGKSTFVPRSSPAPTAQGYKLYPYFGGDELAPHNIRIRIREEK